MPFPHNSIEQAAVNENYKFLSYCRQFSENFANIDEYVLNLDSSVYSFCPISYFL